MCSIGVSGCGRGRSAGPILSVARFIVRLRIDHMFGFCWFIEHMSDYRSNMRANIMVNPRSEEQDMTSIEVSQEMQMDDVDQAWEQAARQLPVVTAPSVRGVRRIRGDVHRRPGPARPARPALRYRGSGTVLSRVQGPHRRRPITPATTVGLALLAALITLWLGVVAQFGDAVHGGTAAVPEKLAVVQVHAGESLRHVAVRVAPDAPVGVVVDRIKELNRLQSTALDAGQTLIAPVG